MHPIPMALSFLVKPVLIATAFCTAAAHANLRVYPTRLTLSDKTRVGHLTLRHLGDKTTSYKISLVFYKMTPEGTVQLAPEPDATERAALKLLRFSPRSVTLDPNVDQVVRVMYAGPKDLPEGDYRAHLHFEPTDEAEAEEKPQDGKKKEKITMKLSVKLAVAVPVIFRRGNPKATVALEGLKLVRPEKGEPQFELQMVSSGNAYPHGDFHAYFVPAGDGTKPVPLGVVRSVASYIPKRKVSYSLTVPEAINLSQGKLKVEFRETEENGGAVLAHTEAALGQ